MIYGLGMQELLVILAIVMLLFGGKRLPELGQGLGKAIRGFRQAEDETTKELKRAAEGEEPEEGKRKEEEKREEADEAKGEEATEEKASEETKGD